MKLKIGIFFISAFSILAYPLFSQMNPHNLIHNSSFEEGESLAEVSFWNRMNSVPTVLLDMERFWRLDSSTAWEGTRSLRGEGGGALLLSEEVWESIPTKRAPWVFSVYLKADRAGVKCRIGVGMYWRLAEEQVTQEVELTTDWKRYELPVDRIPNPNNRHGSLQGPVNFRIMPPEGAVVWVDASPVGKGENPHALLQ